MKRIAILAAASLVLGLAACNKDNKTTDSKAAPAAAKASPGAVNEKKSDCCKDKSACATSKDCCKGKDAKDCCKTQANTSAGAVSEKKDCSSSCSEKKSTCSESKNTSAGAVSEKKDCSSSCSDKKSTCTENKTAPGAVSAKSGCPGEGSGGTCPFAGAKNG